MLNQVEYNFGDKKIILKCGFVNKQRKVTHTVIDHIMQVFTILYNVHRWLTIQRFLRSNSMRQFLWKILHRLMRLLGMFVKIITTIQIKTQFKKYYISSIPLNDRLDCWSSSCTVISLVWYDRNSTVKLIFWPSV